MLLGLLKEESGPPAPTGYTYLGFYTTSISNAPVLYEMIINYTGGTIAYNSTEEIGATTELVNSSFDLAHGITYIDPDNHPNELSTIFDSGTTSQPTGTNFIYFSAHGNDKFYFYIKLDTPIPDVTAFKYWTYQNNSFSFNNLQIYGTNTDPANMGTGGADMNNLSNWTLLSSPETTIVSYTGSSYTPP